MLSDSKNVLTAWLYICAFIFLFLSYQAPGGKENYTKSAWESQLDQSMVDQSKQKILQILNTGCLKELKSLQQIGDKKAKLILGWREIHGHFAKVGKQTLFTVASII